MELPELINALASRPGPVLTWYGESRTELGGGVAARWLAKTANLLAGDLAGDLFGEDGDGIDTWGSAPAGGDGPAPTGTIRVDLGSTWQSVTWLASSWLSGWRCVGTGMGGADEGDAALPVRGVRATGAGFGSGSESGCDGSGVDVWVTDRIGPEHLAAVDAGCWVLAQATTPLALAWPGPLPEGVLDALAELSAQSDALEIAPEVPPDLVVAGGGTADARGELLRVRDLAPAAQNARAEAVDPASSRVLLTSRTPVDDALSVVRQWGAGCSVVMVDPGIHDGDDRARIAQVERARG